MMPYPALADVPKADKLQLGRWMRFLPSPETPAQQVILSEILFRFQDYGGWNPIISKAVGWDAP